MIIYLIKGIIVGIAVSAPMGPIGVLCVQKTVNKGKALGFYSGLGAATADTFYAIITAFGLTYITNFLLRHQLYFEVIGISVLLVLGLKMFFSNPVKQFKANKRQKRKRGVFSDYISTFFLTISNPLTIIFYGTAYAALGLIGDTDEGSSYFLIAGIFSGATLWWYVLTTVVNLYRHKFKLKIIWNINRISGIAIITLSCFAIIQLFIR
ncbi:MAG: lysine transporter LysE [Bacteroidetes bacterium]|nr:MAG: lysine transporter LysE [Bacteroidota bacterium]